MMALGIMVFVSVAILGVATGCLRQARDSSQETRAAHVAQQIVADLSSGTNQFGNLVLGTNYDNPSSRQQLDLTVTNDATGYYDGDGLPVAKDNSGVLFKAAIHIQPEANLVSSNSASGTPDPSTLARVEVAVTPVSAGTNAFLFVTKVALSGVSPTP